MGYPPRFPWHVLLQNDTVSVDPCSLLQLLRQFPAAADYFDGGQHDCQEVLRALLDLLHEDLVSRGMSHG